MGPAMITKPDFVLDVLLPVYNAGEFLKDAVDSIARQTFTGFRCFICDASTDGSSDFLTDFSARDPRFIIIRQQKCSLSAALQEGLLLAEAPLVARMDADDISLPNRFAVQLKAMEQRPELLVLGSDIQCLDEHGRLGRVVRLPNKNALRDEILWRCPLSHPTVIFRRREVLAAGGYREFFKRTEDYDLWLRLSRRGELDNLAHVLLYYRIHRENSTLVHALEGRRYVLAALASHMLVLRTGLDPLEEEGGATCEELVNALPHRDRVLARGKALAGSARLLGDPEEDPEGGGWLEQLLALPRDAEIRRILASYHLHLVKRYIAKNPPKSVKHFALACQADTKAVLSLGGEWLMQHIRRIH